MSEFEDAGSRRSQGCEESHSIFQSKYDGSVGLGSGTLNHEWKLDILLTMIS